VDRSFGGTVICDRLDQMRRDRRDVQPTAVVLENIGNNVTDCMRGPNVPLTGDALVQKYRDDARIATGISPASASGCTGSAALQDRIGWPQRSPA
jgi:hypothetical protein